MAIILHVEGDDRTHPNPEHHCLVHNVFKDNIEYNYDWNFNKKAQMCAKNMLSSGYLNVTITQEDTHVKGEENPLRYRNIKLD